MTSKSETDVALAEQLQAVVVAIVRRELSMLVPANEAAAGRLLAVDDAAARLGIGRSRLYHELATGDLRSVKVGRRRLIPEPALIDYIRHLQASNRNLR